MPVPGVGQGLEHRRVRVGDDVRVDEHSTGKGRCDRLHGYSEGERGSVARARVGVAILHSVGHLEDAGSSRCPAQRARSKRQPGNRRPQRVGQGTVAARLLRFTTDTATTERRPERRQVPIPRYPPSIAPRQADAKKGGAAASYFSRQPRPSLCILLKCSVPNRVYGQSAIRATDSQPMILKSIRRFSVCQPGDLPPSTASGSAHTPKVIFRLPVPTELNRNFISG